MGIWSVRNLPSGSRSRGCRPSRWGLIGPSTMALAVGLVVGLDRSSVSGYWDQTRAFVVAVLLTLGFFPARLADRTTQAPGRRAVPGSACRGELARTSATAGVHLILSAGRVVVVFAAAMTSIVDTRGAGVCPPSADMDFPYKLPGFSSQTRSHALFDIGVRLKQPAPAAGPFEGAEESHEAMDSPAFRRGHRGHDGPLRRYRGRPSRPTSRARRM